MFYETVKEMSLDYSVNREKKIELFGDVDLSELVLALDRFGCRISSAQIMEENLESYYRKLMGEE